MGRSDLFRNPLCRFIRQSLSLSSISLNQNNRSSMELAGNTIANAENLLDRLEEGQTPGRSLLRLRNQDKTHYTVVRNQFRPQLFLPGGDIFSQYLQLKVEREISRIRYVLPQLATGFFHPIGSPCNCTV